MNFNLSDQQRDMIFSVRELVRKEIAPNASKYMGGTFPWDNIKALAKLGVLGMAVPEEYGGMGLPVLDTALVLEEIAKGCYVTAMATLGEAGVQTRIISTYAPAHIKERVLPLVVSGDCILAICMTEPHAGTDVANYKTSARTKSDRIILQGTKTLISRAPEAGMFVVFARIDDVPGRAGIGCVLIEAGTPGLEVTGSFHTMGGEYLHEVQFNNCELPTENLIIREDGFKRLLNAFNTQRCLNPSISLGLAEGAFEAAVSFVQNRSMYNRPVSKFQGVRWKLADMYADIETCRGMLYRACASADPFPDPFLAALAKVRCNEMSMRVTSDAIQLHGGVGFTDEYAVSRFFRAARYGSLGGGTSETLRDLIGKKIIAMSDKGEDLFANELHA